MVHIKHRTFFLSLVLFVVLAYSAFWFYLAQSLQESMQESLKDTSLSYEMITKHGFPLRIEIALVKPRFSYTPPLTKEFTIANDKEMLFSYNLLGTLTHVQLRGTNSVTLPPTKDNEVTKWQVATDCTIDFKAERLPYDFFEVALAPLKIAEEIDGAFVPMYAADSVDLKVKRDVPATDRQLYTIDFDLNGWQQLGVSTEDKMRSLYVSFKDAFNAFFKQKGKFDCSFELQVELPSFPVIKKYVYMPLLLLHESVPMMSVTLSKLHLADRTYDSEGTGKLAIEEQPDGMVSLSLEGDGTHSYTPKMYESFMTFLDNVGKEANSEQVGFASNLAKHIDDFKALVPHLDNLSPFTSKQALTFELSKKTGEMNLKISQLEFSCALFGIDVVGFIDYTSALSAQGLVSIAKHKQLVDASVDYYNKLVPVCNLLDLSPQGGLHPLSDASKAKIEGFLTTVGVPTENKEEIEVHLGYDNDKFVVGKMSQEDFDKLYGELRTSLLQEAAPSLLPPPPAPKK